MLAPCRAERTAELPPASGAPVASTDVAARGQPEAASTFLGTRYAQHDALLADGPLGLRAFLAPRAQTTRRSPVK